MSSRRKISVLSLALLVVLITPHFMLGQDGELAYRGRTIAEWAGRLKNPNATVRRRAAVCLGEIGAPAKSVAPMLVEAMLKDLDAEVGAYATNALVKMGSAAVPALTEVLKSEPTSPSSRLRVVATLNMIGREAKAAVPALIVALKDEDVTTRSTAIITLMRIGVDKKMMPALIEAINDKDASVRGAAADALVVGGPVAVPPLIAALKDKSPDLRVQVIDVLARIGEPAKAAVPALLAALKDDCRDVQQGATKALARVGPADVPALIGALKDRHDMTQSVVLGVLYELGPKAKGAETDLGRILTESENASSRVLAARVLGRIGPDAKAALPDLIEGLRDSEVSVRAAAACALGSFGKAARDAVPALIEALTDKNDVLTDHDERVVGRAAGDALKQIDPDAAKKAGVP